jgi:hypothetical protein
VRHHDEVCRADKVKEQVSLNPETLNGPAAAVAAVVLPKPRISNPRRPSGTSWEGGGGELEAQLHEVRGGAVHACCFCCYGACLHVLLLV